VPALFSTGACSEGFGFPCLRWIERSTVISIMQAMAAITKPTILRSIRRKKGGLITFLTKPFLNGD
jgi:hypothetical protein